MSGAIVAGDLVIVKQFHCESHRARWDGKIFRVELIRPCAPMGVYCISCETNVPGWYPMLAADDRGRVWPVEWLRRIPPLAELETVETQERAPA